MMCEPPPARRGSHPEPPARPPSFDAEAFERDLLALRAEIDAQLGAEDLRHLQKMERWGRLSTALGYATAWIAPNPVSPLLIAPTSRAARGGSGRCASRRARSGT